MPAHCLEERVAYLSGPERIRHGVIIWPSHPQSMNYREF
jgi:hypothetical protein